MTRTELLTVRLTADELAAVTAMAARAGVALSDLVRLRLALPRAPRGRPPKPAP